MGPEFMATPSMVETSRPASTSARSTSSLSPGSTTANYGYVECLGEFEVAGIVGRNGHDGARAVADKYVVGDPNGNGAAVYRIDGV